MLLSYVLLLLLPVLVVAQESSRSLKMLDHTERMLRSARGTGDALDWIGESLLDVIDAFLPASRSRGPEERRKKLKLNKYVLPLIVGFMLIKSILLPIALKALAVLSGKAVVLSLMSLILAAIVGLKKVAQKESNYDVVNAHRRQDTFVADPPIREYEPYRFYADRRR